MIAEIGPPDTDRLYPEALRQVEFCPPSTTRLVEYYRKPFVPWVDDGAEVVVCVDGTARIVATRSTSPW